jgi:hypothetical protein
LAEGAVIGFNEGWMKVFYMLVWDVMLASTSRNLVAELLLPLNIYYDKEIVRWGNLNYECNSMCEYALFNDYAWRSSVDYTIPCTQSTRKNFRNELNMHTSDGMQMLDMIVQRWNISEDLLRPTLNIFILEITSPLIEKNYSS